MLEGGAGRSKERIRERQKEGVCACIHRYIYTAIIYDTFVCVRMESERER